MAEQDIVLVIGNVWVLESYLAHVSEGNTTVRDPPAGILSFKTAVIIMLLVVFTVEGSNLMSTLWKAPGRRVTVPESSVAEMSVPILAVKGEVIRAGEGFKTLSSVTTT